MKKLNNKPPKLAEFILSLFLSDRELYRLGDYEEIFQYITENESKRKAYWWYWLHTVKSIPELIKNQIYWSMAMFSNYLKIAIRNIKKQKGYSFINITGLAIGIVSCLLIFLYVYEELSYDTYHVDSERIYRVVEELETKTSIMNFAPIAWPVAPALIDKYPQIENAARVYAFGSTRLVKYKENSSYEDKFIFAENDIFKVLTFPFLRGNPITALEKPSTVVISERVANKYFSTENPIGKTIQINNYDYEITGVMRNFPINTHLKPDFIASMKTIEDEDWMSNWLGTECYTYIKLRENVDIELFKSQMINIANDYIGELIKARKEIYRFSLQAISDIHLYSNLRFEIEPPGNITSVIILGAIGFMILIIAAINFMNLSTARSVNRAKEVGLRKVIGGFRRQLISQFIGESFFITFLSIILAMILVVTCLPYFNELADTKFTLSNLFQPAFFLGLILILIIIGLGAGSYPALFLSGFKPIATLKGSFKSGSGSAGIRKILVIGQFAISITLIISTIIIFQQIDFMKNQHLGFDKEKKLVIPVRGGADIRENYEYVKNELLKHPDITGASASSNVPGRFIDSYAAALLGTDDNKNQSMYHMYFDSDFISTYDIEVVAGRPFKKEITSDVSYPNALSGGFLINEAAVKALGCKSPNDAIGLRLETGRGNRNGLIIGVTKDFHYRGLQNIVEPLVMEWYPNLFDHLTLSITLNNLDETLSFVKGKWSELYPNIPFESFFLDNEFDSQYRADERFGKISTLFTFLGIFIACLGLLGLASFMAEQRTKEIGIRKVLGASVSKIILLLSIDFTKWILISNIIAWPIAWFLMNTWLQDFAYHTEINFIPLISASVIALLLAFISISFQAIKAATANPVEALKYE